MFANKCYRRFISSYKKRENSALLAFVSSQTIISTYQTLSRG